jgi:polysaccharide deacetylase family protein (PEP-CTERM system associated)
MADVIHGLSIDVEEYFQVEAAAGAVPPDDWPNRPSRVEPETERVLALLDEAGCRATFFCLGWVAERRSALIRRIANAGHEIASHGYAHAHIRRLSPEAFREDVHRAKGLLEDLVGRPVLGYRAPTFSIVEETLWALDVLIAEGFRYDSSIFPVRHDRYGIPSAPRHPHVVRRGAGEIVELPPLVARLAGRNIPLAGGGYLRLLPLRVLTWAVRRMAREGAPAVIYFHPWEIDPDQPRLPLAVLNQFRHRVGLSRTERKLRRLLSLFPFSPLASVAAEVVFPGE